MEALWYVYLTLRLTMGVAGMLCNSLTLVCVFMFAYLRSSANILIASLALSDFLHGALTSIFLLFRDLASTPPHISRVLCLIGSICLESITIFAQLVSFSMLALERRNSLLFQLNQSKKWNRKVVICILCVAWAVIVVCNICMTIIYSDAPEGTACNLAFYFPMYYFAIGGTAFVVTCVTIAIGYGHIAYIAYKSQTQVVAALASTQENRQSDMRITRMIGMVVGVFLLLYTPVIITVITLKPTSPLWQRLIHYVTVLIYDINFWINPFIFAWRDKRFNKAFRQVLSFCKCCFRQTPGNPIDNSASQQVQVSTMQMAGLQVPSSASNATDTFPLPSTSSYIGPKRLIPRIP